MKFDSSPFLDNYLASFDRLKKASFNGKSEQLPSTEEIKKIITEFYALLFPTYEEIATPGMLKSTISRHMEEASNLLYKAIKLVLDFYPDSSLNAEDIVSSLLSALPEIRETLKEDAHAGFMGDPAAKSEMEIILTYPGFRAIVIHRIAHFLYEQKLPLIPRMLNEIIHGETGIDIHPGATIGKSFFIDHGTGVVIGETTIIGNSVKIYQGVTLGALSFPKDACGLLLRGERRHPTIEDNVTIYANATILGPITIGRGSTIGSNAWVKESVKENSRVIPKLS